MLSLLNNDLPWVPRRFRTGGGMAVEDGRMSSRVPFYSCVLCGGVITDEHWNFEHILPQWLHRFAGDAGEKTSPALNLIDGPSPTWRQLSLAAHRRCNTQFGKHIESPVRSSISAMVEGGTITSSQLDLVLDWLDKIRSASGHMALAYSGHSAVFNYGEHAFPNWRVGLFDRAAMFFRVDRYSDPLDVGMLSHVGFLTTPTALFMRIGDLVIVSASNNHLLSRAFGLSESGLVNGRPQIVPGSGKYSAGFGTRSTRLGVGFVVAQPMRRQHKEQGHDALSSALRANGDGHIYRLGKSRWERLRFVDFSQLPVLDEDLGAALATLEVVEWIILTKEQDHARAGEDAPPLILASMPVLVQEKLDLIEAVGLRRFGLRPTLSDRPTS